MPLRSIYTDVGIEAAEIQKMAKYEVAVVTWRLAKRDEIAFGQLQIGMEVERRAMVNLKPLGPATNSARRKLLEVMLSDSRPMRRARSSDRMLAFSSIDEMTEHRKKPAERGLEKWFNAAAR